jgi:hypothetical protein
MRLMKFLAGIGTVVTLSSTLVLTVLAARVGSVAGKAQPQPQQITLAQLVENGPGDNLYVTLTDFSFGAPVVDQFADEWPGAWVPLYVGHRTNGTPPALYYSRRTRNRAELDEFLKKESFNALVVSALNDSALKFEPAAKVYTAHPKLDPQKTLILTEPVLGLGGDRELPPERWFNRTTSYAAWGLSLGMLMAGILCAITSYRLNRRSQEMDDEPPPPAPSKTVEPNDANVISVHHFTLERAYFVIGALTLAMVCMFVIGGVLLQVAVRLALQKSGGAPMIAILGFLMAAGAVGLGIKLLLDYYLAIREVAILEDGIRWLRWKKTHFAAWTDVRSVFKKDLTYLRNGVRSGRVHTIMLCLYNGQTLRFSHETLEDYDLFADRVQRIHSRIVVQRKEREIAEKGVAAFGPVAVRKDGITIGRTKVPFAYVERFEVTDGQLTVHASNVFRWLKSKSIPLNEIPNYMALLEMLRAKAVPTS